MKHATKQEASAARNAALQASRERRTYAKHVKWAEEMRTTGRWIVLPADAVLVDAQGSIWKKGPDGYRHNGNPRMAARSLEYIQRVYGLQVMG